MTALLLTLAAPAAGQEQVALTESETEAIAAFYNRPETIRLSGETRVPAGAELNGDVASLGGPLRVAGVVRGDVVVINGEVTLLPGARISGDLTVVGGEVIGDSTAVVGEITVFPESFRFRSEGGRITPLPPERPSGISAARTTRFGRTEFTVAVDGSYNRVEGLPVRLGPRVELGQSNPTILEGALIYRTRSGLRVHPDEFGHQLEVEQFIGGRRSMTVGASLYRVIDPIERNGLTDTENSLSTFILHRDYRDHYNRRGWSAFVRFIGRTRPYEAGIAYRDETHGSITPGTPWSLLDNDEPWRPQPQVAEGDLRTVHGWFVWDSRNDRVDPATGWLIDIGVEQGVEGDLSVLHPSFSPGGPGPLTPRPVDAEFSTIQVDVRRYLRISPRARLALRAEAAGSPDDAALPPQRQHVLGGEGTLPGYPRLQFDCGAREVGTYEDGYFPYYGCDRSVLLQAELRYAVLTGHSLGRALDLDFDLLGSPELVVFADAGRAWIEDESLNGRLETGLSRFRYDAGLGLRLGRLGVYMAVPLPVEGSNDADAVNFFVRVGPRI